MSNLYPLWRMTYEEIPCHDRKISSYIISAKFSENTFWYNLYETTVEPLAKLALSRLKEIFCDRIQKWIAGDIPAMFEVNDQVYKTTYVFPNHSCICGDFISGNVHYGEIDEEPVKYDYITNIIFFYENGDCLVKGNQLFLDGELCLNTEQLKDVCSKIGQPMWGLDSNPTKLISYIKEKYPNAKRYICKGYEAEIGG